MDEGGKSSVWGGAACGAAEAAVGPSAESRVDGPGEGGSEHLQGDKSSWRQEETTAAGEIDSAGEGSNIVGKGCSEPNKSGYDVGCNLPQIVGVFALLSHSNDRVGPSASDKW